jgi:hypothetical protein
MLGKFVLVRTYSAGVHVGTLKSHAGTQVELTDARRIWRWYGANTLNEISQKGVGDSSKISEAVPTIALTEAIELIPCSDVARENLSQSRWK